MENTDHSNSKIPNEQENINIKDVKRQIDEFERRLKQEVEQLRQDLKDIEQANLISPKKAAEILGITVEAVRKRAARGSLTKRNGDGSKKITNRRTEIFFDEQEVRNKI